MNKKTGGQLVVDCLVSQGVERVFCVPGESPVCEVGLGKGRVVLLGFSVQNRAQPHGTFKLLFNAIYRSTLASNQKTANE